MVPRKRRPFSRKICVELLEQWPLLAFDTLAGIGATAQYFSDSQLQTLATTRLVQLSTSVRS